ncbi:diamine acetyltransferase 2-like isoform X2 [Hyposmocoma kahamanoa]|uniref:diamine acetyltransferase 2-like isoform X2 n=1 Tax=Hyposmocoma kahamanoa TaxID=1477025 RepID=UPI000E6D6691|nr:diamine acetyltransferase 2-like isoform X2 [Hyposmocoma kahamanoa]
MDGCFMQIILVVQGERRKRRRDARNGGAHTTGDARRHAGGAQDDSDLVRDGFESSPPWFFVLLAVRDEQLLGQALCNYAYSSWTGRSFYLEDLYVYPHVRRLGVARRLLQHLCEMAVKKGVSRIDWHVLKNNAPALALYARTGARDMCLTEGRVALRLDAPRIQAVAQGHLLPPAPAQV